MVFFFACLTGGNRKFFCWVVAEVDLFPAKPDVRKPALSRLEPLDAFVSALVPRVELGAKRGLPSPFNAVDLHVSSHACVSLLIVLAAAALIVTGTEAITEQIHIGSSTRPALAFPHQRSVFVAFVAELYDSQLAERLPC